MPQCPGLEVKGAMEEASLQQSRHTVEVVYDLSKIESDPVRLGSRFAFKANTVAFIFCNWKILLEKKRTGKARRSFKAAEHLTHCSNLRL